MNQNNNNFWAPNRAHYQHQELNVAPIDDAFDLPDLVELAAEVPAGLPPPDNVDDSVHFYPAPNVPASPPYPNVAQGPAAVPHVLHNLQAQNNDPVHPAQNLLQAGPAQAAVAQHNVPCCIGAGVQNVDDIFEEIVSTLPRPRKFISSQSVGNFYKQCFWIVALECRAIPGLPQENHFTNLMTLALIKHEFNRRLINCDVEVHFGTSRGRRSYAVCITKRNCQHQYPDDFCFSHRRRANTPCLNKLDSCVISSFFPPNRQVVVNVTHVARVDCRTIRLKYYVEIYSHVSEEIDERKLFEVRQILRLRSNSFEQRKVCDVTTKICPYANDSVHPEALVRWPVSIFEDMLPRFLNIFYKINCLHLQKVIPRSPDNFDRMSRMCIPANGIIMDPVLTELVKEKIRETLMINLDQLQQLKAFAKDTGFPGSIENIQQDSKFETVKLLQVENGVKKSASSLFELNGALFVKSDETNVEEEVDTVKRKIITSFP